MKTKAVVGVVGLCAALLIGNGYKNSLLSQEIDKGLRNIPELNYSKVSCNGLLSIDCAVSDLLWQSVDSETGKMETISAKRFVFNDVASWKRLEVLDGTEQSDEAIQEILKEGIELTARFEALGYYDAPSKEAFVLEQSQKFTFDNQTHAIAQKLIAQQSQADGLLSLKVKKGRLVFGFESNYKSLEAKVGTKIDFDHKQLKHDNINEIAKKAIIERFDVDYAMEEEAINKELFIEFKLLCHKKPEVALKLAKTYGFDGDMGAIDYEHFVKLFRSQKTLTLIDNYTQELKASQANLPDSIVHIIDKTAQKFKSIVKGDGEIAITLKSSLSYENAMKEFLSYLLTTKTSKPIEELIEIKIK